MAGKRQHFIPQFLQEGFASRRDAENAYIYVYRKGRESFETNTKNSGVEGYFYTDGMDTAADDIITGAEDRFSRLIGELRQSSEVSVSMSEIAELLAHLEVRTRHIRQSFRHLGGLVVEQFLQMMEDEDAFLAYVVRIAEEEPQLMVEAIREQLPAYGVSTDAVEDIWGLIRPYLPSLLEKDKEQYPRMARGLRNVLPEKLSGAVKAAQIDALKRGVSPHARAAKYAELKYFVVSPQQMLPLGDSMLVVETNEAEKRFKAFVEGSAPIEQVYLPLSASKLLIGTRNTAPTVPADLATIIAQCSLEHFIAAEKSDALVALSSRIGETAIPLTDEELQQQLLK